MRYYPAGTRVLANCGSRKNPEWIPGVVIIHEFVVRLGERHFVKLAHVDKDGKDEYWFPVGCLIEDNPRNRRNKNITDEVTK